VTTVCGSRAGTSGIGSSAWSGGAWRAGVSGETWARGRWGSFEADIGHRATGGTDWGRAMRGTVVLRGRAERAGAWTRPAVRALLGTRAEATVGATGTTAGRRIPSTSPGGSRGSTRRRNRCLGRIHSSWRDSAWGSACY